MPPCGPRQRKGRHHLDILSGECFLSAAPRRMRKVQGAERIEQTCRVSAHSFFLTSHARVAVLVLCLNLGNIHLPLSAKKQTGLVQLSESCPNGLRYKARKTSELQRSKTLDISSSNRKPWKGWE